MDKRPPVISLHLADADRVVRDEAARLGITVSTYIRAIVRRHVGMSAPVMPRPGQTLAHVKSAEDCDTCEGSGVKPGSIQTCGHAGAVLLQGDRVVCMECLDKDG